jgi:hypothetical protein
LRYAAIVPLATSITGLKAVTLVAFGSGRKFTQENRNFGSSRGLVGARERGVCVSGLQVEA